LNNKKGHLILASPVGDVNIRTPKQNEINIMEDLVRIINGKVVATSKEVADHFGKTHFHVLEKIDQVDCSDNFRASNFRLSSYVSKQNKELKCVNITRDGFAFLGMGFTGKKAAKFKEDYIAAFNKMESALKDTPSTMDELNRIVKEIENDADGASKAGKLLYGYRGVKVANAKRYKEAAEAAQLALGF